MRIDASGVTTTELLNTLFYEKPEYDTLEDGTKGRIVKGYDGIMLYGGFGVGKTLDILTALQFVARYQRPNQAKRRKIKVGVVRESNSAFVENFASKIEMFNTERFNKKFEDGFHIYDATNRAKCIWRFLATYPDAKGRFTEDGTMCEIEMHCMAVSNESDIKKWKGAEMTIIVFNEMNNYSERAHDVLSGRKNRYPFEGIDYQFWIGDLNPGLTKDWDHQKFIAQEPIGTKVIRYEPPLKWEVDEEGGTHTFRGERGRFVENLKFVPHRADGYGYWHSLTSGTDRSICNNVLGEYFEGSTGEAVHKAFQGGKHLKMVEDPLIEDVIIVGIDPGFANGFVVGYFSTVEKLLSPEDIVGAPNMGNSVADVDKFNVLYSFAGDGGWNKTFMEHLLPLFDKPELSMHRELNRVLFIADPRSISKRALTDGTMTIDIIQQAGFTVAVPVSQEGAIVDDIGRRLQTVDKYLKEADRFAVHPRNRKLITAFVSGYVTKRDSNEPDKKKSGEYGDVMDALQYPLLFKELGCNIGDYIPDVDFRDSGFSRGNRIHNMYS